MEHPLCTIENEGHKAQLGIIEFDDQGHLWRTSKGGPGFTPSGPERPSPQLSAVLRALGERARKKPVHLVIFVHGWNNNASECNGNLRQFKQALGTMALLHDEPFGVFISWRGMVLDRPILLDIYNREASSIKIGQVEATAAIQALCATAKHGNRDSRVIAVGHSLGGVILLRAMAQPLAADVARAVAQNPEGTASVEAAAPLADTVVMVNPADTAVLASQMVATLRDYHARFERNNREAPLLVSFTSKGDWATGWLYHSVTWVSRHLLGSLMTSSAGATSTAEEEHATVTSVGFHSPLYSHELVSCSDPAEGPGVPFSNPAGDAASHAYDLMSQNYRPTRPGETKLVVWLDPSQAGGKTGTGPLKPYELKRMCCATNTTPYWIFQVPTFVVADHTDVWNPNFVGLLTALHHLSQDQPPAASQSAMSATKAVARSSQGLKPPPLGTLRVAAPH